MLSWGLFFGKASSPRKLAEFDESSVDHASSTQVKGGDLMGKPNLQIMLEKVYNAFFQERKKWWLLLRSTSGTSIR
nr:PREDICTED: uncharacterized protein LOC108952887 isoform X2 [Musa acuminata subsp. malaccensis]